MGLFNSEKKKQKKEELECFRSAFFEWFSQRNRDSIVEQYCREVYSSNKNSNISFELGKVVVCWKPHILNSALNSKIYMIESLTNSLPDRFVPSIKSNAECAILLEEAPYDKVYTVVVSITNRAANIETNSLTITVDNSFGCITKDDSHLYHAGELMSFCNMIARTVISHTKWGTPIRKR